MPSFNDKHSDVLELAGLAVFGIWFGGLAAVVGTYLQVF